MKSLHEISVEQVKGLIKALKSASEIRTVNRKTYSKLLENSLNFSGLFIRIPQKEKTSQEEETLQYLNGNTLRPVEVNLSGREINIPGDGFCGPSAIAHLICTYFNLLSDEACKIFDGRTKKDIIRILCLTVSPALCVRPSHEHWFTLEHVIFIVCSIFKGINIPVITVNYDVYEDVSKTTLHCGNMNRLGIILTTTNNLGGHFNVYCP
jgi:hypothetical protein